MAAQSTTQNTNGAHGRAELRHIPLSQITVQEGFNPRGEIIDAELDAMAETMRERGCLQPVLVRSTGGEDYLLIAGERRYRAATKAELTEIPANVLPAGAGDEAERLELLTDAMIENEVRSDLNPLQRAQGYKAMLDCGLNVRGVAERLGGKAKRSSRERRIRDHLAIPRPAGRSEQARRRGRRSRCCRGALAQRLWKSTRSLRECCCSGAERREWRRSAAGARSSPRTRRRGEPLTPTRCGAVQSNRATPSRRSPSARKAAQEPDRLRKAKRPGSSELVSLP